MKGQGDGSFGVAIPVTRADFATLLYNWAGRPEVTVENPFTDVAASITRQEMVQMLYKYAMLNGMDMSVDEAVYATFADTGKVDGWAVPAMKWAVTHDIIAGKIIDSQKYMAPLNQTPR